MCLSSEPRSRDPRTRYRRSPSTIPSISRSGSGTSARSGCARSARAHRARMICTGPASRTEPSARDSTAEAQAHAHSDRLSRWLSRPQARARKSVSMRPRMRRNSGGAARRERRESAEGGAARGEGRHRLASRRACRGYRTNTGLTARAFCSSSTLHEASARAQNDARSVLGPTGQRLDPSEWLVDVDLALRFAPCCRPADPHSAGLHTRTVARARLVQQPFRIRGPAAGRAIASRTRVPDASERRLAARPRRDVNTMIEAASEGVVR